MDEYDDPRGPVRGREWLSVLWRGILWLVLFIVACFFVLWLLDLNGPVAPPLEP